MSDVNILIQTLNNGERHRVTNGENSYDEIRPPTRTALQAARALQHLAQRVEMDQHTINRLAQEMQLLHNENAQLRQELKEYHETKTSSNTTSDTNGTGPGTNTEGSAT